MSELRQLYRKIQFDMPDSIAKVEAIKDGIRLADQHNEIEYGFKFRMELIEDAAYCGIYSDVRDAAGAMGWIFKKIDENCTEFTYSHSDIIDLLQWICRWLPLYPEITLEQIDRLLEDLKKRMSEDGYDLRFYHEALMVATLLTDQSERAAEAYKLYRKKGYADFVDCSDCIGCRYIKYLRYAGRHKEAMKEGKAMVYPGTCNMNPKTAYNELLASAVENEDYEDIDDFQQKAYKMIARDAYFTDFIGYHIQYFAHKDPAKGLNLYTKHLPWTLARNRFPMALYDFNMGAAVLFKTLLKTRKSFKAELDKRFPLWSEDGKHDIKAFMEYYYNEAAETAALFDKRNGTDYFKRKLDRLFKTGE